MTDRPILYSFRRCPYAMRARMALLISGIVVEMREVVLRDKPAEMIAISPKATVPVLQNTDVVIDESLAIMRWALGRNDPENWLGGADDALIEQNDGPFKHHLDRYKYPERYGSDAEVHRSEAMAMLQDLDRRLGGQPQLGGSTRGLADIALFPFIRQFAEADRSWFDAQPIPHLKAWLAGHLSSALFTAAMVRLPQWKAGDAETLFPGEGSA